MVAMGCDTSNKSQGNKPINEISISTKDVANTFEMIKKLEGEWEGEYEWTGAITGRGSLRAKYQLNGRESAVIENLISKDGTISMTSVYHLDGPSSLKMSHFCTYNQPRLKATSFGIDNRNVTFGVVDVTNLKSENSGHVYGIRLDFLSPDRLNITFNYKQGDDKKSVELAQLTRIQND